jgi:hypothetical protein
MIPRRARRARSSRVERRHPSSSFPSKPGHFFVKCKRRDRAGNKHPEYSRTTHIALPGIYHNPAAERASIRL